ncbi:MAG: hypothetical protein AB7F64_06560 [Gammaproteobacteria bacterium]
MTNQPSVAIPHLKKDSIPEQRVHILRTLARNERQEELTNRQIQKIKKDASDFENFIKNIINGEQIENLGSIPKFDLLLMSYFFVIFNDKKSLTVDTDLIDAFLNFLSKYNPEVFFAFPDDVPIITRENNDYYLDAFYSLRPSYILWDIDIFTIARNQLLERWKAKMQADPELTKAYLLEYGSKQISYQESNVPGELPTPVANPIFKKRLEDGWFNSDGVRAIYRFATEQHYSTTNQAIMCLRYILGHYLSTKLGLTGSISDVSEAGNLHKIISTDGDIRTLSDTSNDHSSTITPVTDNTDDLLSLIKDDVEALAQDVNSDQDVEALAQDVDSDQSEEDHEDDDNSLSNDSSSSSDDGDELKEQLEVVTPPRRQSSAHPLVPAIPLTSSKDKLGIEDDLESSVPDGRMPKPLDQLVPYDSQISGGLPLPRTNFENRDDLYAQAVSGGNPVDATDLSARIPASPLSAAPSPNVSVGEFFSPLPSADNPPDITAFFSPVASAEAEGDSKPLSVGSNPHSLSGQSAKRRRPALPDSPYKAPASSGPANSN